MGHACGTHGKSEVADVTPSGFVGSVEVYVASGSGVHPSICLCVRVRVRNQVGPSFLCLPIWMNRRIDEQITIYRFNHL